MDFLGLNDYDDYYLLSKQSINRKNTQENNW